MRIGLDVGSTTIKAAVLDAENNIRFTSYERHFSMIIPKAMALLEQIAQCFPHMREACVAISGSAGLGLGKLCEIPFVQEVFATRQCALSMQNAVDAVIELGGEDAKILFLGGMEDARMNGSCAGGTGAFIDQMATLLKLTPEELNEKAKQKEKIYSIASRCGVFAKSDVQPLLNQGAKVEDIAASILYAVVNQTVGGLAQGRPIRGNVIYLGGPLTFMSELRAAFDHVLQIEGILPLNSLYFVAIGAALQAEQSFRLDTLRARLRCNPNRMAFAHTPPLFQNEEEYEAFAERHRRADVPVGGLPGFSGRAHLGIDAGSTTLKTALIDENGAVLHTTYQKNSGNPVPLVREVLLGLYEEYPGIQIGSATATGYGEQLIAAAFRTDFAIVETIAHYTAARKFDPDVDFIIDIGGQDMKCFQIRDNAINDIFLNEACSSGCGSFLQTFAEALGQDVQSFSQKGLFADAPVELGSRCTVFMNSSVKQAQKDGASIENISAGLSISVVKNALYKVIRTQNPKLLGRHVVVQGGTFYNDAVLRAFEMEMGMEVSRPSIAGLMGAYGAALYGRAHAAIGAKSSILGPEATKSFAHHVKTANCGLCTNRCLLTANHFSDGRNYISGNRCERPLTKAAASQGANLNIYEFKRELLQSYRPIPGPRGKIGLPLGLNFLETLPFWHAFFTKLGFEVVTSPPSTRKLYFEGQGTIPSDTVCYPAKLMHGHIRALCDMEGVNAIFYPCMTYNRDEGISDNHFNCPVVAYYPEVIEASCGEYFQNKTFIYEYVGIHRPKEFTTKMREVLQKYFGGVSLKEVKDAAGAAYAAYDAYMGQVQRRGREIIEEARACGKEILLLCGRPYHIDSGINHGMDKLIVSHGAAVISEDSLGPYQKKASARVLNQWTYHARMYVAAEAIRDMRDIHLVQLVSFGCGLDAVTADEVREILQRAGRLYTQIKIDEIVNLGAVNIRLRSLFAALEQTRKSGAKKEAV